MIQVLSQGAQLTCDLSICYRAPIRSAIANISSFVIGMFRLTNPSLKAILSCSMVAVSFLKGEIEVDGALGVVYTYGTRYLPTEYLLDLYRCQILQDIKQSLSHYYARRRRLD